MTAPFLRWVAPLAFATLLFPAGRALADDGSEGADGSPGRDAFAVTSMLERIHPGADEEELEYLAFLDASRAALGLTEPLAPRLVLAADVEPDWVEALASPPQPHSAVRLTRPIPLRRVVSLHVDDGTTPVTGGDPEMLWYDATELNEVLRIIG